MTERLQRPAERPHRMKTTTFHFKPPMKYSDLLKPRNTDAIGAAAIVGKGALFERMVKSGWISPVVDAHSCKLYAIGHVEGCCDLLENGYLPGTKEPDKATINAAMAGSMRPPYAKA